MSAGQHAKLTELFTEALGLSTQARAQLVEQVRQADGALANELAALLAADAVAATQLETGGMAQTFHARKPADVLPRAVPSIEGYRIVDVLGAGGMGTVYAAEQDAPRRLVAIKILHARSQGALARFWTESEIMARLDHPGIARVLEAGRVDGEPYLVMERVDGTTLDAYAAQGLPLARRVELLASVCDAVHHAHVNGVIHRDLKPSNVMVRPDGRITVLDFGIARVVGDDGSTPGDTRAGELIGTPLYMSPEQARLRPDAVDARSDVYSLGVMLYELAAGELPYPVRGLPLPEVTRAICQDAPRPLGRGDAALRGDLDAIAQKALAKSPAERYQSAAALGEDVRAYLAGLPVTARTPGTLEQLARFVRRRPWLAVAIGGVVVAAMAFAVVVTVLWLEASHQRTRAEHARDELIARTDQLVLRQARAALAVDPTEAVTWLASLKGRVDAEAAWGIADEALGRGIASDVVRAHGDEIHWVEPLPGGGMVSGGYDGRVLVWSDPPTQPREVFRGAGRIHTVRPSPDGALLAIGGDDGALHVIARDGRVVAELTGHAGDVQRIEWSRDGAWLVTADDHGGVWRWTHGGLPGTHLAGPTASIAALAIGPDGAVVAGGHEGRVFRWALDGHRDEAALGAAGIVGAWAGTSRVEVVDADGNVVALRLGEGGFTEEWRVATDVPAKHALFWSAPGSDDAWAVLAGVGGAVVRVDARHATLLALDRVQVRCLAIAPDGARVAAGSDDGVVQEVDLATGRRRVLRGHRERVRHVEFAAGGAVLWSSDGDGIIRRWDLAGAPPTVFDEPGAAVEQLAASADGARVASVDAAGNLSTWALADGGVKHVGVLHGHASAVAFAGDVVVTGTVDGVATWWGGAGPVVRPMRGVISAIAVSRDGARVAVATKKGPIGLFAANGDPLGELPGNTGGTEAIAFDARGELLASGGQDRVVRVWRVAGEGVSNPDVAALPGPRGDTHFVAFAGDLLVSAANDGAVRAWTMHGGAPVAASARVLAEHTGAVTALAFDPSGAWLASAGRDRTVQRTPLSASGGASSATPLSSPAVSLMISATGELHAVTSAGTVERWPLSGPVAEVATGARTAVPLGASDRWVVALTDGALAIQSLHARPLADLAQVLARTHAH